jgi:enoyl-CoA hydratase
MASKLVALETSGPVARLTLTRPESANAIDLAVLDALESALREAEADTALRCVVLTGEGRTFSAGGDIHQMRDLTSEQGPGFVTRGQAVLDQLSASRLVVIAEVNGPALGGGAELALACDIRIASDQARIGFPEVGLGLIPAWGGTQRATRLLGQSRASLLILTGEPLTAIEALSIGLLDRVVPASQLPAECERVAARIAANSPAAVAAAKRSIVEGGRLSFEDGLHVEAEAWLGAFRTNDRIEGLSAFLERRGPNWTNS